MVEPLLIFQDLRLASPKDIAAMKLNAIVGNGPRVKDFIDVAYLSSILSLSDMISAYQNKYQLRNPAMVIKALDYHNDINFNESVEMVTGNFKWKYIRERLQSMTLQPHKLFSKLPG